MRKDRVASKAVTDMASKIERLIQDDPLVDIAVKLLELRAIFEKHDMKPPVELLFDTEHAYRNFLNVMATSKRSQEFFNDGDPLTNPFDMTLMGLRIDYKRRKP